MRCRAPVLLLLGSTLLLVGAGEARADELGKGERPSIAPEAEAPRPVRPDPRTVFAVSTAGAPARGADDALVTMVVASEFSCRFCAVIRPKLERLLREYRRDLRVVYRDFIVYPDRATIPALAACAAHRQRRYLPMADLIWEKSYPKGDFSRRRMERLARSLHLDVKQLRRDMKGVCSERLRASQRSLAAIGTRGAPTFWINGRTLTGNRPIDDYRDLIEAELARARRRLGKEGTTRRNYYRKWVLERGEETFGALSDAR